MTHQRARLTGRFPIYCHSDSRDVDTTIAVPRIFPQCASRCFGAVAAELEMHFLLTVGRSFHQEI